MTRNLPAPRRPRATTEALEALQPAPGTYWRARRAFKATHTDRLQTPAIARGTVLMLASIEFADGEPHVYVFAPHPLMPEDERDEAKIHADDLHQFFEPAPDGEQVRAAELERLQLDMEQTKAKMLAPPPEAVPVAALTHNPAAAVGTPGQALATPDSLQAMREHAERLRSDAEARAGWIQTHSRTLATQGAAMAYFHQERAEAALARAQSQLDAVASLLKTVENLKLYTGEGIHVLRLREGAPAAPDLPLTIYQDVLAFDEETLIHLDEGGLDHTQTEALIEALADRALVARLIPAERGVTLVRFREQDKEFIKTTSDDPARAVAAARYNRAMNEESQRKRLLVRDGERLTLVDIEGVLDKITQLLPSAGEQDSYYRRRHFGRQSEPITREAIDYAAAQREQVGALDAYGQVLIALWGLADRTNLFETAQIPRFANWLDPAFQQRYLRLLSLDTLLGQERPTFSQYQAEHAAYLAPGVTVAVDLGQAVNDDTMPGIYGEGRWASGRFHRDQHYAPALPDRGNVLIARVLSDPKGLYVTVPCRYDGYRYNVRRQTAQFKLYLRTPRHKAEGVLVLDRVRSPDLDYYLTSRKERRRYERYVSLFRAARAVVATRDAREQPWRERVHQAVLAARLPHDPDRLDAAIRDALATARTARPDGQAPQVDARDAAAFERAVLDALHATLTDGTGRVAQVESWARAGGREPLRLVHAGGKQFVVYLTPTDADHDARLGPMAHALRQPVRFTPQGEVRAHGAPTRVLLRAQTREAVLHDWPEADTWLAKQSPFRGTYAAAQALIAEGLATCRAFAEPTDYAELVATARRYMRNSRRRFVERMGVQVIVGTALHKGEPRWLLASADALHLAHLLGDDAVRAACRRTIQDCYAHPDGHLKDLAKVSGKPWRAEQAVFQRPPQIEAAGYVVGLRSRGITDEQLRERGKNAPEIVVTSLSPLGARLLPHLIPFTKAATE